MSQGKGNPCNDKHFEIVKILYETLSSEIRQLETNYLSLIIPLITSIAIYGYGVKEYLFNPCRENSFPLFVLCSAGAILICIIVWFSSNILAYTHRSNQIALSKIEERYGLYSSNILPNSWNYHERIKNWNLSTKCNFIKNDSPKPPEIYRLFKILSLIVGVGIVLHILLVLDSYKGFLVIISVVFLVLILVLPYYFSWFRYRNKL